MDTTAAKALVKAQSEMGAVLKNAQNPHLKKPYADLGSVLDACAPALHDNGFAILQPVGQDEFGPYVETVFMHETGEQFRSRVHLLMGKTDMQALGSAITYARRYGLLAMAGLAPEDDDGEATKAAPRQRTEPRQEAPAPKAETTLSQQAAAPAPQRTAKTVADEMIAALRATTTAAALDAIWKDKAFLADYQRLKEKAPAQAERIDEASDLHRGGLADPVIYGEHSLAGVM